MGFDVRKHYINKSKKDGKITSRGFVCAKQGIRGSEKEDLIRTHNRDDTRINCPQGRLNNFGGLRRNFKGGLFLFFRSFSYPDKYFLVDFYNEKIFIDK